MVSTLQQPASAGVVLVRPPAAYPLPCDIYGVRDGEADDVADEAYVDACGNASDNAHRRPRREEFRRQNEDASHDTKPCDFADCVVVKDRIFGSIALSPKLAVLVRSPEFQRLRRVEQNLNLAYAHGAHLASTEFQHALGTFRIGDQMLRSRAAYHDPVLCGSDDDELPPPPPVGVSDVSPAPLPPSPETAADDRDEQSRQSVTATPVLFDYRPRCRQLNATLIESIQLALLAHSLGALPFPHLTDTDRAVRPFASASRPLSAWLADYLDDAYESGGFDARGMASGRRRSAALLRRMAPRLVGFTAAQIRLACDIIVGARDRHPDAPAFAFQFLASRPRHLGVDRIDQMLRDAASVGVPGRRWASGQITRRLCDATHIDPESGEFVCDDARATDPSSCEADARGIGELYHSVRLYTVRHSTVRRADELTVVALRQVAATRNWARLLAPLDLAFRMPELFSLPAFVPSSLRRDDWTSALNERAHDLLRSVFAPTVAADVDIGDGSCPPSARSAADDDECSSGARSQTTPDADADELAADSVDAYRRLVSGRFWDELEDDVDDTFDRAVQYNANLHAVMGLFS